jgi:hypothetical protein
VAEVIGGRNWVAKKHILKAIKWLKTANFKNIGNNHQKKQKLTSKANVKGKF